VQFCSYSIHFLLIVFYDYGLYDSGVHGTLVYELESNSESI